MKKFLLPIFALALAACNSNNNPQTDNNVPVAQSECLTVNADSSICTMQIDGVKMTWIRDNAGKKNNDLNLFGNLPAALVDSLGIANGIPASMSAILMQKDSATVLFDAGLGMQGSLLMQSLQSLGVKPEDIKLIYLTHLHPDHIGGLMADGKKVFPNAKVYVVKDELDAWLNMPAEKNGMQLAFSKMYADNLVTVNFNDVLPAGVTALDGRGHTPGHTVFQAGKFLVVGDLMHGMKLQMAHPEYCAFFDMDSTEAVKSRVKYINYARENGLTMVGMHLPEPGFVK